MNQYYVLDAKRNAVGVHEIHLLDCDHAKVLSGVHFLGRHSSCERAIIEAKTLGYSAVECCAQCAAHR